MDPINIITGMNVIAQFGAHYAGAKQGLRAAMADIKDKPKGFLQTYPPYLSAIILVFIILGVFQIGTFSYDQKLQPYRLAGLAIYLIFSWVQILCYKALGKNYSQEVVIFKKHNLVTGGIYRVIRHPHYLSQILSDLGASFAVMSFIAAPLALLQIPVLFMRAKFEEKLLKKHFRDEFDSYKKKTGGFLPFIG